MQVRRYLAPSAYKSPVCMRRAKRLIPCNNYVLHKLSGLRSHKRRLDGNDFHRTVDCGKDANVRKSSTAVTAHSQRAHTINLSWQMVCMSDQITKSDPSGSVRHCHPMCARLKCQSIELSKLVGSICSL
jgi:hypothetical protein